MAESLSDICADYADEMRSQQLAKLAELGITETDDLCVVTEKDLRDSGIVLGLISRFKKRNLIATGRLLTHRTSRSRLMQLDSFFDQMNGQKNEKRQFYSKLQEKSNAKEEEKAQMQAKTEKENEEALKVLRRSLTFKASPMPSFYQEGPTPKFELKKMPTTQAKSPKFSMRCRRVGAQSLSNAASNIDSSQSDKHPQQHMYGSDVLLKGKDGMTEGLAECSLLISPGEQNSDLNFSPSSRNEGADLANKENEGNHEETFGGIERMNNNQKPKEGTRAKQLAKGEVTKASSERHQSKYSSNGLRNCANKVSTMSSSRPNNMKPMVQPLPSDMKEDASPITSKITKKERLKALTPYFRKRESIGNGRKSTTALPAQEDVGVLVADFKVGT